MVSREKNAFAAGTQPQRSAQEMHKGILNPDIRPPRDMKSLRKIRSSETVRAQLATRTTRSEHVQRFSQKVPSHYQEVQQPTATSSPKVEYFKQTTPLTTPGAMQQKTQPELREKLAELHTRKLPETIHIAESVDYPKAKLKFNVSRRAMSLSTSGLAAVLLFGYIAYLNFPNVAVRVAASRAGFEATMPNYKPSGYTFAGPIHYSSEQVVISFRSTTDEREYQIVERETNWDSGSLLENYVRKESDRYLTFQESGLTVYIYNGSNAAWVNRGVWYRIDGDAPLNTEQVLKIAASL